MDPIFIMHLGKLAGLAGPVVMGPRQPIFLGLEWTKRQKYRLENGYPRRGSLEPCGLGRQRIDHHLHSRFCDRQPA